MGKMFFCKKPFKVWLTVMICSLPFFSIHAQDAVKVGAGVGISSCSTKGLMGVEIFADNIYSFAPQVGVDWLSHKYWYLSSVARWQRLGGEENDVWPDGDNKKKYTLKYDYLHLNTTFRAQYPIGRCNIYAGAGMYVNCLMGDADQWMQDITNDGIPLHSSGANFGEVVEVGLTTVKNRIKLDFNAAYHIHNNKMVTLGNTELSANYWNVSLSVGYIFGKQ